MHDHEIMKDFEADKYVKAYCNKQKCHDCAGADFNGEPNGYGCTGLDLRIDKMYKSILKRRKARLSNVAV